MICAVISDGDETGGIYLSEFTRSNSILRATMRLQIDSLLQAGYNEFYVNCTLGIPLWAAYYISFLKLLHSEILLHLILPYNNFNRSWCKDSQEHFSIACKSADSIAYACEDYTPDCFEKSENMMIECCDLLLACGTPEKLMDSAKYAQNNDKQICFFRY